MRELKYKLRIGDKIVGYEKWCVGGWLYSTDGSYWHNKYIYHTDKDQFTGLCDKKGREIYEGDVAKAQYWEAGITQWNKGEIKYDQECQRYMIGYRAMGSHIREGLEII